MIKKLKYFIPYLIFLILLLVAFRDVLSVSGMVGHTWDWGLPHFREQYWGMIKDNFFIWDDSVSGGHYFFFRFELIFWILMLPLSLLGAELLSKIITILFLFVSAVSMYKLSKYYKLCSFWAVMSGIFYMFTPVTYSRIIAGHLNILLGYSLLPMIIVVTQRIIDGIASGEKISPKIIFVYIFLFMIETTHTVMLVISTIVIGTLLIWHILFGNLSRLHKWTIVKVFSSVFLLFILINSYWLLPAGYDYLRTKSIRQFAGLSLSAGGGITEAEELPLRKEYIHRTEQPLINSIRLYSRNGIETEYIWPIPNKWKKVWDVISFSICLVFFGGLLKRNSIKLCIFIPYYILAILGIALVSGYRTFFGGVIYKMLYKFIPIIYMDISHTPRMLNMVYLCYAIVVFYVLNSLESVIRKKWFIRSIGVFSLAIFVLPFINGNITKPLLEGTTQPFSIKINKINPEDKLVYKYFGDKPEDFRLTYLPPAGISWTGETDLSYEWNVLSGLSPKPEFLGLPEATSLSYDIVKDLYSVNSSPYIGKLLGLANVKYIVYPNYKYFVSYRDFIPEYNSNIVVEGFKNYKPIIDNNLERQEGLLRLDTDFNTVTIFENKFFLPHIYIGKNKSLVFCKKKSGFVPLSYTDCFNGLPIAIFIEGEAELEKLKRETSGKVNKTFIVLTKDMYTTNFYMPEDAEYQIQCQMRLSYILKEVEGSMYNLDIFSAKEWMKWTITPNMVAYDYKLEGDMGIVIACDFNGNSREDEYIQMKRRNLRIDLKKYPCVEFDYKVENSSVQTIELVAGLDFDGDGIVDGHVKGIYTNPSSEVFSKYVVNLYSKAWRSFPDKENYDLIELELYPHKLWGVDCSRPLYNCTYLFWIKNVNFVNYTQKEFARVDNILICDKSGVTEEVSKDWHIIKKRMDARAERMGKGVIFKKEKDILEIAKDIMESLVLLHWQNIELEYIANPSLVKKIMLIVDLEEKEDIYVTDLKVNSELTNLNVNIYDILKQYYPDLKDFKLKKIKFWVEENEGNFTENKVINKKTQRECNETHTDKQDLFYINKMQIYSLGIPEDIVFKKDVISIDGNILRYKHKFSEKDKAEGVFWQDKVKFSRGWHQISWILNPDEYLNLDWAVLRPFESIENDKISSNVDFVKINPTKYIVYVKDAEDSFWLVFLENFHEGWRAYIRAKTKNLKSEKRWWENSAIWTWVKTSRMKKLDAHFEVNGYANGWWVDLNKIKNHPDMIGTKIKNNAEGFEVIIEFIPQRYYELGFFIAGFIIIWCFGFILFEKYKNRW